MPVRAKVEALRTTQKIYLIEDWFGSESVNIYVNIYVNFLFITRQVRREKECIIVSKREVKHFSEIGQLVIIQFVLLRLTLYGLYWLKLGGCCSAARLCVVG